MTTNKIGRRGFLSASAAAALGAGAGTKQAKAFESGEAFTYEIDRTEDEWRAMLSDAEFRILREGGTERPKSHPLWQEKRAGTFCCRGCDLTIYRSLQRVDIDRGWVFFRHSYRDAVLTGLDLNGGRMGDPFAELGALMEVHCRRCGSHLGHIVNLPEVPKSPIHCINGTSLRFEAAET